MKKTIIFLFLFACQFVYSQTNQPPVVSASGDQAYCPLIQISIVTTFTITDVDDTGVDAFYIQISSGYQSGSDQLILTGSHPTITSSWNVTEGKLTLSGIAGGEILLSDLENAVRAVVFESTLANPTSEKIFSLTVGDANYLAQTDHFYEYVANTGVTWSDAKTLAENRRYFGLQGYLVTIVSPEEAQLVGEQATGTGWIGGSDEEQEGVWKWVTGPEAGTVFWNGEVNGTSPNFAFWNVNEPNNYTGNDPGGEHYAHITDPSVDIVGAWNDLPNFGGTGLYIARGYVVEYGGTPGDPVLNISASTRIYIPEITNISEGEICNSGSITLTANASNNSVFWFDAPTGGNLISSGDNFTTPNLTNTTTYYASAFDASCTTNTRTAVTATVIQTPTIISVSNDLICSEGNATISATPSSGSINWYTSLSSTTPLFTGLNFDVLVNNNTTFYAEAVDGNCTSNRVPVQVIIDGTIPQFDLVRRDVICLDIDFVDVSITNPVNSNYVFEWKNEAGNVISTSENARITEVGTYFVTATSIAGCVSDVREVAIFSSEVANIALENFIISDDTSNNSIKIISENLGLGDYEFSLDAINGRYTSQTLLENILPGVHTLFIRDKNGCGISQYQFSVLNYPNFFTPDGDGTKDFWELEGYQRSFYTVTDVIIFDRFGRVLKIFDANNSRWNGVANGAKSVSSNYWFKVKLIDVNGRKIEKRGYFSLLRR